LDYNAGNEWAEEYLWTPDSIKIMMTQ
jgi:hypothetical protein